ncbi:PH domain-containing protein [Rathayibacter sp. YIM 133350]|uniref:PH domain-containing protein n=1 Tax=Rathayibacter sp. YIM 133350 TaxID=3131992 RepID=UPI00307F8A1A
MSTMGDPQPGATGPAAPGERVIARIRRHARVLFWPTVLLVASCAAVGYFAWSLPEAWMGWALWGGLAAIAFFGWLVPFIWWLGQRCTITTRRVIIRSGFFVRTRQEVAFTRIYDVSVRRSWLQSAFRSGDVLLNSGADRPVVLRDVPRAGLIQRALHDLTDAAHGTTTQVHWQNAPSALTDQTVAWGGR